MPPEALGRRVFELVRRPGNAQSGIFQQAGRAYEPCPREILLRRWKARTKEPAHQRAGQDIQRTRQGAHRGDRPATVEQRFEEPPAVVRRPFEFLSQHGEGKAIDLAHRLTRDEVPKAMPPGRIAHINEVLDAAISEIEHRMRRALVHPRQQRHHRDSRELAHKTGDTRRMSRQRASDRHEHGGGSRAPHFMAESVNRIVMHGVINPAAGGINARSIIGIDPGEHGRRGWGS